MTTNDVMLATRLTVVRASVRVGAVETAYWRAGAGATVILLGAHPDRDEWFAAQLVRLASACRLIVPEHVTTAALGCPPAPRTAFSHWLHDFIEGLGVCGAVLIATDDFAASIHSLDAECMELLGAIMLVSHRVPDTSADMNVPETPASAPTYFLHGEHWCDDALRRVQALSANARG